MSHFEAINAMRLVRIGPGLKEGVGRWIAAAYHRAVVTRLRRFREELGREMAPVSWMALEAPMVTLLADVCDALSLDGEERASVLGQEGEEALEAILGSRPVPRSRAHLNERQLEALRHVRQRGSIANGEFQELCPDVSPETLRLDLADLVARGLLTRNGSKRGTHYVLPK